MGRAMTVDRGEVGADAEQPAKTRRGIGPLRMLEPYLRRYPGRVALTTIAILLAAAATIAVPLAIRRIVDHGFSRGDSAFIDRYFGMMLLGLILALASAARFYCVNWLGERVIADLKRDVFAKLVTLSPVYYETAQTGELLSRLTADTGQIRSAIVLAFSQTLRNVVLFVGSLIMMFATSTWLSLLVLLTIPLVVVPLVIYGRSVRKLSRRAQDTLADTAAFAGESLAAIRTLQANAQEEAARAHFTTATETAFASARDRLRARGWLTGGIIFLVFAAIVGILWHGAAAVLNGTMSPGSLVQFVLYAVFAAGALSEMSDVWGEVQQAAGAAERLSEILGTQSAIRSPALPVPMPEPPQGRIEFRNVGLSYQDAGGTAALTDVSFTIAPGETVAIVGPSGAGKSSVFNLIVRFFDPSEGAVLIDGVRTSEADLAVLRGRLAIVPQDLALFADTVAANIRYGRPDASAADVERAAQAAHAHEFIQALAAGYHTPIGERGIVLSGGQRQRIAIARAILRNAPILLLDEATSALDAESERLVQDALPRVMAGRTTLVIAHRLSTVLKANRILVMDKGRIVEEGSHQELTRRGGLYARLAELQLQAAS